MRSVVVLCRMGRIALALGVATAVLHGGRTFAEGTEPDSDLPIDRGLMQRLANFTLNEVSSGRTTTLYGYQGRKAIVLVFVGNECPVGSLYAPRLVELNHEFRAKGVVFLGINSNAQETEKDVAKYVKESGIDFPVLKDSSNSVADSALVERTCEVILLDGAARIRYRGAIDDQYGYGKNKGAPTQNYLRDALNSLLSDKPIKVPATKAVGCLLDRVATKPVATTKGPRVRPAPREIANLLESRDRDQTTEVGKVSYAADVATIIENKCQTCHRPGQTGPFPLLSYDDARKHSAMIKEVVTERRMPPWHADPRFGHFSNDRSLNAKDRATLLAWVDQGTPLGDPKILPPPRKFLEGWSIGKPDVVFELPAPYYVPAQGLVAYVYFRVPTNFTEERWIQAAQAIPSDPSVVHHIIVYLLDPSKGPEGRRKPIHFCGYAPGEMPSIFPEGTAKRIPAGAELLFQVHYTPTGRVRTDRSRVGLVFAKSKPVREAFTLGIANPNLLIPPRQDNVAVSSSFVLPSDARLLSLLPHMHLRGKDFKYTIAKPGEPAEVLLSVPAYDFGWQTYYTLTEPMDLPKGTRVDCLAHFDNSENNLNNPDPSQLVRWGEQTFEEMLIGYLDMDVPIGTPVFDSGDFAPATAKATMATIQVLRRLVGSDRGNTSTPRPGAR